MSSINADTAIQELDQILGDDDSLVDVGQLRHENDRRGGTVDGQVLLFTDELGSMALDRCRCASAAT